MTERSTFMLGERSRVREQALLREKARHCRELAYSIGDDRTKRVLLDMARGFDERARALEPKQPVDS